MLLYIKNKYLNKIVTEKSGPRMTALEERIYLPRKNFQLFEKFSLRIWAVSDLFKIFFSFYIQNIKTFGASLSARRFYNTIILIKSVIVCERVRWQTKHHILTISGISSEIKLKLDTFKVQVINIFCSLENCQCNFYREKLISSLHT